MKRSIPTDISFGSWSGHAFQTIVGKVGCPLISNAPFPVDAETVPVSSGVVRRNGSVAVRPSDARAVTQMFHELAAARLERVASCSTAASPSTVQSVGVPKPYAIRDATGSLVRHAIVAEDAVSAVVWTSEIVIGVVETAVVVVAGSVVVDPEEGVVVVNGVVSTGPGCADSEKARWGVNATTLRGPDEP